MTFNANPSACGLASFHVSLQNSLVYMYSKNGSVDDKGE
jgi:hypothetical protein